MTLTKNFFLLILAIGIFTTSCGDNEDPEPDQTTQATGTYEGTYEEGESGSSISIDEVDAVVTKKSSSEIDISLQVIPGLASAEFSATMDSETTFTIPQFTLNDEELQGSGSIMNDNTLDIKLTGAGASSPEYEITYVGERK